MMLQTLGANAGWGVPAIAELRETHAAALDLFDALIDRMHQVCERRGIRLQVALLAGRSHLLRPESLSGQYQEMLRREILRRQAASAWPLIDLAGQMRERSDSDARSWYFPHDGHLTPAGHRMVASLLIDHLRSDGLE